MLVRIIATGSIAVCLDTYAIYRNLMYAYGHDLPLQRVNRSEAFFGGFLGPMVSIVFWMFVVLVALMAIHAWWKRGRV